MSNSGQYLHRVHAGYKDFVGDPDHVVQFRHTTSDENIPTEMDILFFLPINEPGEDNVTLVATAGMSSKNMHGPYEHIEIALEIKGGCEENERQTLAKQLAELAVVPFREGRYFAPNMVLEEVHLCPFRKMPYMLVTKWNYSGDIFLPGIDPSVALLRLTPLYKSEADIVEEIGDIQAIGRFLYKGMLPEDFERNSVV